MPQYDRCRIEVDYRPEFAGIVRRPMLRLAFEFASQDDPLLLAILARWRADSDAQLARDGGARLDIT